MAETSSLHCRADPRSCQSITDRAAARLQNHSHFRGRSLDLSFEITGDILIIRGSVPTFYLKQLLQTVLREMENVSRIENHVDVVASDGLSSVRRQADRRQN
jgi:hypothetical protein